MCLPFLSFGLLFSDRLDIDQATSQGVLELLIFVPLPPECWVMSESLLPSCFTNAPLICSPQIDINLIFVHYIFLSFSSKMSVVERSFHFAVEKKVPFLFGLMMSTVCDHLKLAEET